MHCQHLKISLNLTHCVLILNLNLSLNLYLVKIHTQSFNFQNRESILVLTNKQTFQHHLLLAVHDYGDDDDDDTFRWPQERRPCACWPILYIIIIIDKQNKLNVSSVSFIFQHFVAI